jgi:predicted nuclease with RNAse H fold
MALGTDRRERWVEKLRRKGFRVGEIKSKHEIDAALAAVTAWLHASGRTEMVGNEGEGIIVIPLPRAL